MLKIRLSQTGKKHQRHYRLVVSEARSKRDGKTVAQIGFWNPMENVLKIDKEAYDKWIKNGALPTEKVKNLVEKQK